MSEHDTTYGGCCEYHDEMRRKAEMRRRSPMSDARETLDRIEQSILDGLDLHLSRLGQAWNAYKMPQTLAQAEASVLTALHDAAGLASAVSSYIELRRGEPRTAPTVEDVARLLDPDAWNLTDEEFFEEYDDGMHGVGHCLAKRVSRMNASLHTAEKIAALLTSQPTVREAGGRGVEAGDQDARDLRGTHARIGAYKAAQAAIADLDRDHIDVLEVGRILSNLRSEVIAMYNEAFEPVEADHIKRVLDRHLPTIITGAWEQVDLDIPVKECDAKQLAARAMFSAAHSIAKEVVTGMDEPPVYDLPSVLDLVAMNDALRRAVSKSGLPAPPTVEEIAQVLEQHQEEANDIGFITCQCAPAMEFDSPDEMALHQAYAVVQHLARGAS